MGGTAGVDHLRPRCAVPPLAADKNPAMTKADTPWLCWAIATLEADQMRSADTHLVKLYRPELAGIDVYLKGESTHPTGSLKHRLARSLFLYGLGNSWIAQGTPIVEASSGSTAISEAYFARMLGLPLVAVVPQGTAPAKLAAIVRLWRALP